MGAAASFARRAFRRWNATNRAIKYLDKTAARRGIVPKRMEMPTARGYEKTLFEKNSLLEGRVLSLDIKSQTVKKSILPDGFDYVPHSTRRLPQRVEFYNPTPSQHTELGFIIPESIPKGKITLKQAINMVKLYQLKEKTLSQLADEYELDYSLVASICKYFGLFEREAAKIWVPPSKSEDKKILLDTPIFQEDNDAESQHFRLRELKSPSD